MYWSRRYICGFLLTAHICFTAFVSGSACYGAAKEASELLVSEVIGSARDRPNPHNPFWIARQKLGLVTEQQVNRKLEGGIFVIDLQTREFDTLLNRSVSDVSFLSGSNRLSFVAVGKDQVLSLFTKSVEGNDLKEYDFEAFAVYSPSWSPDERRVVFANASYDSDLLVADVGSGKTENLGDLGRAGETAGTDGPDWSPDGREIVYVGWDKSSRIKNDGYVPKISRLYVFDLRGRSYRRLTTGSFQDLDPAYSPDGKHIAFVSNRSKSFELWIINRDGTGLRKLTNVSAQGFQVGLGKPAWSPDQKMIAFTVVPSEIRSRVGGFPYEGSRIWALRMDQ
jgi:Tol biopolymer transport system component